MSYYDRCDYCGMVYIEGTLCQECEKANTCINCKVKFQTYETDKDVTVKNKDGEEVNIGKVAVDICPNCKYIKEERLEIL